MKWFVAVCFVLLGAAAHAQALAPQRIVVNGVELHYISSGSGEPVILLHGGQGDYRSWQPQMAELSRYYHVISYSRRYHFPTRLAWASPTTGVAVLLIRLIRRRVADKFNGQAPWRPCA